METGVMSEQQKTTGHGIACIRGCALYGRNVETLSGAEYSVVRVKIPTSYPSVRYRILPLNRGMD